MSPTSAWWEVAIPVRPEAREAIAHFCLAAGAPGLREEEDRLIAYFAAAPAAATEPGDEPREPWRRLLAAGLARVRQAFGDDAVGEPEIQLRASEDWATAWRDSYRPLEVGRRLVVVPLWLQGRWRPPAGRLAIWLEPGPGFGTGEHASTQLALILLEAAFDRLTAAPREVPHGAVAKGGPVVIDVGTGSGILALAAARLGAGRVWACDIDAAAVAAAKAHVRANGLDERTVTVEQADLFELGRKAPAAAGAAAAPPEAADVVVANILFGVLRDGAGQLLARVRPGGYIVLSGLTLPQREPLAAAYEQLGCRRLASATMAGWSALLLERPRPAP